MSPPETLANLTREAAALAAGDTPSAHVAEVDRILQVCNACRYCEGYCAVFPAMTRRLHFGQADVHYLANLCHSCGACLHACQYAPPHPFAVNVPQAMARVRLDTWAQYAWPSQLGVLYRRNGLTLSLALVAGLVLFLLLGVRAQGALWGAVAGGNFYAVFPHNLLVGLFGFTFLFSGLALAVGVRRFWCAVSPGKVGNAVATAGLAEAGQDVLRLRYLDGGHGDGCNNEDDAFSHARRTLHHCVFYGFLFCFASTSVATLYDWVLGLRAPYAYSSLPVLLGTVGGVGLVVGTVGLLWLSFTRHPEHGEVTQRGMDRGFIVLLMLTGLTGLVLLVWREAAAMPLLLVIHLACVLALFVTMPYSKFAHGFYRAAALLKYTIERRLPNTLRLGSE